MTILEILSMAIDYINKPILKQNNLFDSNIESAPTEEVYEELKLLAVKFNMVYKEIATQYIPLITRERLHTAYGDYKLSMFSKDVLDIYKVLDDTGHKLKFEVLDGVVYVNWPCAHMTYSYTPADVELTDTEEINLFDGKLPPNVLAYGIAKEYFALKGDYINTQYWDMKYTQGIMNASRRKKSVVMQGRRWY